MQKGETFTRIILSLNKLEAKGEAVKEKIEKRRTRAYTRAREKGLKWEAGALLRMGFR